MNRQLRAVLETEQQKQDSALIVFLATKNQFDSVKLETNDQVLFLKQQEQKVTDCLMTTTGLMYMLKKLEIDPSSVVARDLNKGKIVGYLEFTEPFRDDLKARFIFEKVSDKITWDKLNIKEQNELLDKKIKEYRYYSESNASHQREMDSCLSRLLVFSPRVDSLRHAYEFMTEALTSDNHKMQVKLDELEANYREKGPKGFLSAYQQVFPDVFPLENKLPAHANPVMDSGDDAVHKTSATEETQIRELTIYDWTEEPPRFPGGPEELNTYLLSNLQRPQSMKDAGISGKVYLRYIVSDKGELLDVKVLKGIPDCSECDAEAIRVVKNMPKWIPGKINGKAVSCYFNLPVSL